MFIACWSAKGGSGTTVVAAGLGLIVSDRDRIRVPRGRPNPGGREESGGDLDDVVTFALGDTLLVDLAGDLPAVLGMPEPTGPGIAEWLASGGEVPPEGLARIELEAAPGLSVIPRGSRPLGHPERAEVLAGLLAGDCRHVIVDCGRVEVAEDPDLGPSARDEAAEVVRVIASSASQSLLVTRACYLSLRRYLRVPIRPSGVVLLREHGRSLSALDVEEICEVPVVAEVAIEPAVARAVDSGLLAQRVPRGLARALLRAA